MTDISLASVTVTNLGSQWMAKHEPSGREVLAASEKHALLAMAEELGFDASGKSTEPLTSDQFEGLAREIAEYLEGAISERLAFHSGFARLESYQDGMAAVRLGGGCQGCPSSRLTLMMGVKKELQDTFGEEALIDVYPALD